MEQTPQLPPLVPGTFAELDRAIVLLGNRTKADLSLKAKRELVALVGRYPRVHEAAEWKLALKQLRNQPAVACAD